MTRIRETAISPERQVAAILRRKEGSRVTGQESYDAIPDISRRLTKIAEAPDVDAGELKRQVRRMLVVMLASADTDFNRRETIKMLSDIEGYKKSVGEVPSSETDRELERLSEAARKE